MDKNIITLQEVANDGQSVFLYFYEMTGMYLAFGLSTYYVTMVTEPFMSYSEALQMPVALLSRDHIRFLRQSLKMVEHRKKEYYRFQLRMHVGEAGYEKWAQGVLKRHNRRY